MLRQQLASSIGALKVASLASILLLLFAWTPQSIAQDSEQEKRASSIRGVAANAQNAKEFETARTNWQKLIDQYPKTDAARDAQYHLGNCSYNLKDFGSAIIAYKKALPILREDQSPAVPEVLVALGYSRYREGKRLAESDPTESASQFTTAANDLNTVLKNHSDSAVAGEAAYHRGKALEANGQIDEARQSYEQSLDFKPNKLRVNSMFNLGQIALSSNNYEDASRWYDRIRTVVDKTKGHPRLNDTNLNYGEALKSLGLQRLQKNEIAEANKKFQEARNVLAEVTSLKEYEFRDDALFLDASCTMYMGDDAKAAELFEEVFNIQDADIKLRERALVLAGSSYLRANNETKGTEALRKSIDSTSSFSVDAAHELALWLIKKEKFKEAFELADTWAPKTLGPPVHPLAVDILLDRANASRNVPELADRSAMLYEEIALKYPNHKLAPSCLYQSAFSNYESGDYDKAIAQTKLFEKEYAGDELTAGIREVLGDTLLMKGENREAESTFRNLTTDFQGNQQDLSGWVTRAGFASFLQGNYDETIQWLEEKDSMITVPKDKAESLHWIGSSHFKKERYEEASAKLRQSLDIDRTWSRTPEVMLALCQTQLKLSQFGEAEETARALLQNYPEDPDQNVSRALYAVGKEAIDVKEFDRAIRNFDLVSTKFPKSDLAPYAIYRAAYAAVEAGDGPGAAKRFANFLEKFPEHELKQRATLGRTDALRMSGNAAESVATLKTLVEEASDDDMKRKANYQLGLAYVESNNWPKAVATFAAMTESLTPEATDGDKVWYELAWAQRENGNVDDSLKSFAKLIENYPKSSLAPEAHFLLASRAYNDKKYEDAIKHYTDADSDLARAEIREKARYKLGWCHYKKGNFAAASVQFKKQVEDFEKGNLYADGRYMIAQCAWRANNFEEAFQAYSVAKPVIEEFGQKDERVKKYATSTLLNGARAGNKTNHFEKAAEMAQSLADTPGVEEAIKYAAMLELGIAKLSLGENDAANEALKVAADDGGETGAHARALMGDILFKEATEAAQNGDTKTAQQMLNNAADTYAQVYFGYGGLSEDVSAEVKSWQAYASYEAARCHMVQINDAKDVDKVILIGKAIDRYQSLVKRFPDNKLAKESKKQIAKLSALKEKFAK